MTLAAASAAVDYSLQEILSHVTTSSSNVNDDIVTNTSTLHRISLILQPHT